jgi:hypothetical protein
MTEVQTAVSAALVPQGLRVAMPLAVDTKLSASHLVWPGISNMAMLSHSDRIFKINNIMIFLAGDDLFKTH